MMKNIGGSFLFGELLKNWAKKCAWAPPSRFWSDEHNKGWP